MTDRELVEWVANAKDGDKLPDEFLAWWLDGGGANDRRIPLPATALMERLVAIGVFVPTLGTPIADLWRPAQDGAREWLKANPA